MTDIDGNPILMQVDTSLEKMQDKMSETTTNPEIPVVRPEKMPEPTIMMEASAENEEDQDIIIS